MSMSVAVMGLRHSHIYDLITRVAVHPELELAAVCEEDEATREQVVARDVCPNVFSSYSEMLDNVECDIIGIGDYYGKRGVIAIEALRRGKHVLSDKPICTSLEELAEIESLAKAQNLSVGCQLDMRDNANFRALHQIVQDGEIGEVHAIGFGGQHPLSIKTRPGWYFEAGKQGGTINDIAVHAIDLIPWLTGAEFTTVNSARTWNAGLSEAPDFHNAAQAMFTLSNGCGVLGDVSYLSPDSHGYALAHYWRVTLWGSGGMAETNINASGVMLYKNGENEGRNVPPAEPTPGGYLRDFLADIKGEQSFGRLSTSDVFRASRTSLLAQHAADNNLYNVTIESGK